MAFITVPLLITTYLVVRHIRRRNIERARLALQQGVPVQELDSSVVGATIVLTSLPKQVMETTLEHLPPEMAKAIILVLPELPPIADSMVEKEKQRWLSHFSPPRLDLQNIEMEEPTKLAAATVKLVLEDSA